MAVDRDPLARLTLGQRWSNFERYLLKDAEDSFLFFFFNLRVQNRVRRRTKISKVKIGCSSRAVSKAANWVRVAAKLRNESR